MGKRELNKAEKEDMFKKARTVAGTILDMFVLMEIDKSTSIVAMFLLLEAMEAQDSDVSYLVTIIKKQFATHVNTSKSKESANA